MFANLIINVMSKIKNISYDVIMVDSIDGSWIDSIDGEFETKEIAESCANYHNLVNIDDIKTNGCGICITRKITKSYDNLMG